MKKRSSIFSEPNYFNPTTRMIFKKVSNNNQIAIRNAKCFIFSEYDIFGHVEQKHRTAAVEPNHLLRSTPDAIEFQ